jgi:hypothetical protein
MDLSIGDTLAMTNMVRAAFGHDLLSELPNATYGDPAACLFYRGLADVGCKGVSGSTVTFSTERQARMVAELWGSRANGTQVEAPRQMRSVIGRFDGDAFPQYNAQASGPGPFYYEDEDEEG